MMACSLTAPVTSAFKEERIIRRIPVPRSGVCSPIKERPEPLGQLGRPEPLVRKDRSEEHTSELQSPCNLVCRLLLEKKKKNNHNVLREYFRTIGRIALTDEARKAKD